MAHVDDPIRSSAQPIASGLLVRRWFEPSAHLAVVTPGAPCVEDLHGHDERTREQRSEDQDGRQSNRRERTARTQCPERADADKIAVSRVVLGRMPDAAMASDIAIAKS